MYYFPKHGFEPKKKMQLVGTGIKTVNEISIVIPVKDDQRGIDRFLDHFIKTQEPNSMPLEIIVVCDKGASLNPPRNSDQPTEIRTLHSNRRGPASARNLGWQNARGEWILFTDSDCIPALQWLGGYMEASNGSIGYAGTVLSRGWDFISRYYETQKILTPSFNTQSGFPSPDYLITANALVWKKALEKIGGFNEAIVEAAGEDIDLGFRLREIGDLSFAPKSIVFHNFDDGLAGFIRRFRRYGKGNRLLAEMYALDMKPRIFKPLEKSFRNTVLAFVQYLSLLWGYHSG